MSTDIAKFFSGYQVPDAKKLADALAGFSASKNSLTGKALLKLTKQGLWVFGIDSEILPQKTQLIAYPGSLSSGYVAWWLGKIEGETMQPLTSGPVDASKLPPVNSGSIPPGKKEASGRGWETQASIEFMTQDSTPLHLIYKTSSLGGLKSLLTLAGEIAFGLSENPQRAYPLVSATEDFYIHKEWGKVFIPVLILEGWLDAEGKPVEEKRRLV